MRWPTKYICSECKEGNNTVDYLNLNEVSLNVGYYAHLLYSKPGTRSTF